MLHQQLHYPNLSNIWAYSEEIDAKRFTCVASAIDKTPAIDA